jgi:uncharacterized protein involved in exopolysaccharide biosynthesis
MTHSGLHPSSPERLNPRSDGPHIGGPPSDAEAARWYLASMRKHWRLLVAIPVTLSLVAGVLSFTRPRPYEARAAFLSSEPASIGGSLGALSSVASQLGMPALSAVAQGSASLGTQFYADLLTSNAVLHEVVTTPFDASAVAENGGKPFKGTLIDYYDATGKTQTDRELATMDAVAHQMLVVTVDRMTGIVRFSVRTSNRQLSALVARRLLDLINEFNLRRRQTQAGAEREFTARRARASLDTLHAAEAALADFRATNIDFSRSPRLANRETELQRRVALAQQIYTTVAQRSELANIEAVRNTPVITVLDPPEGLVAARPRFTRQIMLGGLLVGLAIAGVIALWLERGRISAGVEPSL